MDFKKFYIEKAIYPAMTLLQHNRVTVHTRNLLASERLDPAQRAADLRFRVSELLFLCRDNVPAYSDLPFTELELRREALDCMQAVDPMPLADFLAQAPEFLCRDADPDQLMHASYSPNANLQAELYYSQGQVEQYEAARWRGLSWYGVTYGSPSVLLWDRPREPFFLREEPYMKNRLHLPVCAMTDKSVQPTLEEIDRFSPEYISGSAEALAILADGMEHTGLRLQTQLKVVTVTRGVANGQLRRRITELFGCPVAQTLGMRTEGLVAFMCPEGRLHVTAENCFAEILDPRTLDPVPAGKTGLLAVTDLVGTVMPHLRVVLDFMAELSDEPCPCGRTLPVLKHLQTTTPGI